MILMNDFKKEYKALEKDIKHALGDVLDSGWYILGPRVEAFEKEFAVYNGAKYCIGVASGLEALQIALMAVGTKHGDEVLTVSNSAVATTLAITNLGAVPVFIDIDEYYHMDVTKIEEKITQSTKAIIPVHLFGQTANMKKIVRIAKKHNLKVIEDACQAHGASLDGLMAGTFGDAGAFSFYPTKNLGGYGDGGAIITNSKKIYEKSKMLRNYGQKNRYYHEIRGLNSRLDELQAAILSAKLPMLNSFIVKRNKIADIYYSQLESVKQINLPKVRKNALHSFHLYVIHTERRDALMSYLKDNHIQTLIHYPVPIHKQECFREYNRIKVEKTEKIAGKILSLPVHPYLSEREVLRICKLIKKFYEH